MHVGRVPATAPLGDHHLLVAHQTGETRGSPLGPVVGLAATAPQPELHTLVGPHLGGLDAQLDDARGGDARRRQGIEVGVGVVGILRPLEGCCVEPGPAVELPADPLHHRRRGEPGGQRPQALGRLAVIGLGDRDELGAHPAGRSERLDHLLGQLPTAEHHGLEVLHGRVEVLHRSEAGRRVLGAHGTVVAAGRHVPGGSARPAEAGEHVGGGQRSEVAEAAHPEPGDQLDEVGGHLAGVEEPSQRQRREERRRGIGIDDQHARCGVAPRPCRRVRGHLRGEPAVGDAEPRRAGRAQGVAERLVDRGEDAFGHRPVATEVARRPARVEGEHARPMEFDARHEAGDGVGNRLEGAVVDEGVVDHEPHLGTARLGLTPPQPQTDTSCGGRNGSGDHPVGVQDRDGLVECGAGSDDRPVRAPQHGQTGRAHAIAAELHGTLERHRRERLRHARAGRAGSAGDTGDAAVERGEPQFVTARPGHPAAVHLHLHPAGAEMSVPVAQPLPHRIGAHLQIAGETGDLTGEHQDGATRLGAGLHPTGRARAHLDLRPEQDEVEAVDHRRQDLPPRAVVEQPALRTVGVPAHGHQPLHVDPRLPCRLHAQGAQAGDAHPGATPGGLGHHQQSGRDGGLTGAADGAALHQALGQHRGERLVHGHDPLGRHGGRREPRDEGRQPGAGIGVDHPQRPTAPDRAGSITDPPGGRRNRRDGSDESGGTGNHVGMISNGCSIGQRTARRPATRVSWS